MKNFTQYYESKFIVRIRLNIDLFRQLVMDAQFIQLQKRWR